MSQDPQEEVRRHLAAEAYQWRKRTRPEPKPYLAAVPDARTAVAPPQRPIVVGYDGTAGALPALAWALTDAQARHAPLIIVRAWQWDEELAEPGLVGPKEQLSELAYSTLPDWVRDAEGVSVVLAPRAAGPAIVNAGRDAALIVVGRRRLGAMQRVWLGSTSTYVVQHAPCPVVVVPETSSAADRESADRVKSVQSRPNGDRTPV